MVATLQAWIERGRPKDDPPRSPKGDIIRKVHVATSEDVRVLVRGGTADRGDMARVDVFRQARNGRMRYHLVPIYPHQIADRTGYPSPPDRAVTSGRPEAEWLVVDSAEFLFSLFSHSLLEVAKPDGESDPGLLQRAGSGDRRDRPRHAGRHGRHARSCRRQDASGLRQIACLSAGSGEASQAGGPHMAWRGLHITAVPPSVARGSRWGSHGPACKDPSRYRSVARGSRWGSHGHFSTATMLAPA